MPTVAVLGCGPAGLFVAQALSLHGIEHVIISKKQQSQIYGAQYLHKPIPGLSPSLPTGDITTIRVGRPEVYAERVYGVGKMVTSWDRVVPEAPAWDLRETYDAAWEKFSDKIMDWTVSPQEVKEFSAQFDLVISTVPLWAICERPKEHFFHSVDILVNKSIGLEAEIDAPNWVVYNGTWKSPCYRISNIFGHPSGEARIDPALVQKPGWELGFKVAGTNCDCHPAVLRAGRMGTWERGVLTHHAFERTLVALHDHFGPIKGAK